MMNAVLSASRKIVAIVALSTGVLGAIAAPAHAAQCVPTQVEYLPNQLLLQCYPNNYYAYTTAQGNCPVQTVDTVKLWLTLGQAGLLSGKSLNIYTTNCGSPSRAVITAIDLLR